MGFKGQKRQEGKVLQNVHGKSEGYLKGKLTDLPYSQEAKFQQAKEEEKSERPEFTWKSLIALIFLLSIIAFLLYLYY